MINKADLEGYRERERILYRDEGCMYFLPHSALRGWFSNFTITFPRGVISRSYTVIPHGCATMVFSYAQGGLHCRLFGPAVRPVEVGDHAVECDMLFIVEFQPAGLFALTGIPQKELTGHLFTLAEIDSKLCRQALEAVESANTVEDLAGRMEKLLMDHVKEPHGRQEFSEAVELVIGRGGRATIKELSGAVFYSERHLNRIFSQQMGMTPKEFSRLVRMNSTLRLMQNSSMSLAELSQAQGFYDQSHFIREFQAICGTTPQSYMLSVSDFYNEIAKF